MYFKLALKNVKKSMKDFLIYFLTLAFSVCLFYTFNSFQAQQAVLDMNQSESEFISTLASMMTLLSVFVTIVLAFLILYANNFLIKRRKKELGMYTLLGMNKRNISKILVYETFIISLASLFVGLIAGLFLSQITAAFTASLFRVPLDYHFIFSPIATIITLIAFGGIFFITMLCNTLVLNRYKLIDLLYADRKNDELKIKHTWLFVLVFLLSLLCIGYAYYISITQGYYAFERIISICIAGIIGTFLFFLSLSGFLLTLINHNKRLYLKNLNCFILRQIHSCINTNFISMGFVCIMLLLSIGALSIGLSLNHTMNASILSSAPYDFTFVNSYYSKASVLDEDGLLRSITQPNINNPSNPQELIQTLPFDHSYIKNENYIKTYQSDITYSNEAFQPFLSKSDEALFISEAQTNVIVTPLSSYNEELRVRNLKPIELAEDEVYVYSNYGLAQDIVHNILKGSPSLTIFEKPRRIINKEYHSFTLGTSLYANGTDLLALVMKDEEIPSNALVSKLYWNVNHTPNISDENFSKIVLDAIDKTNQTLGEHTFLQPIGSSSSRADVYDNNRGASITLTYVGIYLGFVFLLASAVILALQQLSQAADNKRRYMVLSKIGTPQDMINRSILAQLAIYFLLPLALAIVHSYVGIQLMNQVIIVYGQSDILMSSIITACIISCVYGSYFLVTYMGYKNIVKG